MAQIFHTDITEKRIRVICVNIRGICENPKYFCYHRNSPTPY